MPAWPDAPVVVAFLSRVPRRRVWLSALRGAACGFAVAIVLLGAGVFGRTSVLTALGSGATLALAGLTLGAALALIRRRSPAFLVERRAPECRNVIVTASEIIARPARVREYIGARVCRDAA